MTSDDGDGRLKLRPAVPAGTLWTRSSATDPGVSPGGVEPRTNRPLKAVTGISTTTVNERARAGLIGRNAVSCNHAATRDLSPERTSICSASHYLHVCPPQRQALIVGSALVVQVVG